jgi:hypothetical protein
LTALSDGPQLVAAKSLNQRCSGLIRLSACAGCRQILLSHGSYLRDRERSLPVGDGLLNLDTIDALSDRKVLAIPGHKPLGPTSDRRR